MLTLVSNHECGNARRLVTVDQLRINRRFVTAKPMPRRRGLSCYPPPIPAEHFSESERAPALRAWFDLFLDSADVSKRDQTIARRLADGESIRDVAPEAGVTPSRVQQIGAELARRFDRRYRTAAQLAEDFSGGRDALRERSRLTEPADFGGASNER